MSTFKLTQTGTQMQADLDKVEVLANIKSIGSNLSLSSGGELSATDTGATSVEVTGSGNAVTSASYSTSTRKISLSKGTTFATSSQLASKQDALTFNPTIPSGTGNPKMSFPSSDIPITPPIPILSSSWMISSVLSRAIPGISLKFAGISPVPFVITSRTDVKSEFANASRGVTDVFL